MGRTRAADRHIDHIYPDISISRIPISVGTLFRVVLRILQLILLDDLLTLDHAAATVLTAVFPFLTCRPATRAVFIILYFRAGYLFLHLLSGTESDSIYNPHDKFI